jgi:NhaP-type Na+/H+ or K+/H+ antiporter
VTEAGLLPLAAVVGLGAGCQWLAWRLRLPAILFLLLSGIVAGPGLHWLDPAALLGDLFFPFVSLSVAVILFEGALTLRFAEIAGVERVVRRAVSTGVLLTWAVGALALRWLADLSWELAALLGAILVVTGPTVIVPMLRTVHPTAKVANILRWEGIIVDPIGALLAVLVFEFIVAYGGGNALFQTVQSFLLLTLAGTAIGVGAGVLLGAALRRDWLPAYLYNLATLATVFAAFGVANAIAEESGLLAVTVTGIYLANRKGVPIEEILAFKESLSLLLISVLFILLAARLDFAMLQQLGWVALWVLLAIQFLARPLNMLHATWGSSLNWRERALLCWIAPRGIVAAAVTALFALRLEESGFEGAELLVPLVFVVIIGTVVLQSLSARPLARLLKVTEPEPAGFLIMGANPLARAVAHALVQQKLPVLLTDTAWDNVSRARMAGMRTYFGNPLSEHAELFLDTAGLGHLLAITADAHLNELACARFREDFGAKQVFSLDVDANGGGRSRSARVGRHAFGQGTTFVDLLRRIGRGAEIRRTNLSESFDMERFQQRYGARAVPLFAIDPRDRLEVYTAEAAPQPGPGWSVVALIDPEPAAAANAVSSGADPAAAGSGEAGGG